MASKNKPYLPNLEPLIAAGIDPKTGLPAKVTSGAPCNLKENIKHLIRIQDEQDAVNRYTWYNLPDGLNGQMLERMLYYKGQLCFFYFKEMDKFYFMPYALDGGIDFYGRYVGIHPIPFSGGTTDEEKKQASKQMTILSAKKLKPIYDVMLPEDLFESKGEALYTSCVLLKDYTEQLAQTITPRQMLNEGIIDVESECIPFMRTALIRATGVKGMRVGSQDEQSNVQAANNSMLDAALTGKVNIPIIGSVDFQELNDGQVGKSEEFMMALQSLDNFRLSTYGLENGGLFQKRERKLVSEQEMNAGGGSIGLIMQDGLSIRQRFCDIVNSIWGLGIWCDVSETVSGADKDMDGELSDQQDQSGTMGGDQPQEATVNE